MTLSEHSNAEKERRLHVLVVLGILLGPLITIPSLWCSNLTVLTGMFPITIKSLKMSFSDVSGEGFEMFERVLPFFFLAVLAFGIVVLIKLIRRQDAYKLVRKFYWLVMIIAVVRCGLFLMTLSDEGRLRYLIGPFFFFAWAVGLGLLIFRQRSGHEESR